MKTTIHRSAQVTCPPTAKIPHHPPAAHPLRRRLVVRSPATENRKTSAPDGGGDETWTCSMHPQIRQPNPGLCPICEMDLIPLQDGGEGGIREVSVSPEAAALLDLQISPVIRSHRRPSLALRSHRLRRTPHSHHHLPNRGPHSTGSSSTSPAPWFAKVTTSQKSTRPKSTWPNAKLSRPPNLNSLTNQPILGSRPPDPPTPPQCRPRKAPPSPAFGRAD